MAVDVNAYTETQAVSDKAVPLMYGEDDVLIDKLFESETLRPYMDDISPMLSGAGNTVQLPIEDSTWAVNGLTEGTPTPVSALSFSSKDLTVSWYGDAKQFTLELESSAFPFVIGRFRENAVKALGENRDNQIISELLNTTSSAIYPSTYDGSTLAETDIFEYKQIQKARAVMRVAKLKPKFVLLHPYQILGLKFDDYIVNNSNYNANVLERGALRTIDGIQLIEHASVQSITENALTTYQALACMEKPAFYAQKVAPMFEMDRINILDRAMTFHYFEAFGVKLKRNEGVIPLKSVSAL